MVQEDSHREDLIARETRAAPFARKHRVRWLGFPPEQDTWEPRSSLLRDVSDVVREYELIEYSYPVLSANVKALIHHESDMVMHDVENEKYAETGNVTVTGYHHDRANETLLRGAREDGQTNVLPPYTEYTCLEL